jgi:hypothetical protein
LHKANSIKEALALVPLMGFIGNKTTAALNKESRLPASWITERKIVGFIQLTAQDKGINAGKVDGFWGPTTQGAFEQLVHQELFGAPCRCGVLKI